MKRLWDTVYKAVGDRYAGGKFRGVSVLVCASVVAAFTLIIGIFGPWEFRQYAWAAVLAGGYAGMAGYFAAIFFQMLRK